MRGLEPLGAQMYVSVPFWPTRASSWNQSSINLPLALSGRTSATFAVKFFKNPPLKPDRIQDAPGGRTGGSIRSHAISCRCWSRRMTLHIPSPAIASDQCAASGQGRPSGDHDRSKPAHTVSSGRPRQGRVDGPYAPCVEPVHPVPQCLTIHPRQPRRRLTAHPAQHICNRKHPCRHPTALLRPRHPSQIFHIHCSGNRNPGHAPHACSHK